MATTTATRLSLGDLFDRHASLVIDADTYQTNPTLRAAADLIFASAGLTADDVARDGLAIYRSHAVVTVFEKTPEGKPIVRDGSQVRRVITVPYDTTIIVGTEVSGG